MTYNHMTVVGKGTEHRTDASTDFDGVGPGITGSALATFPKAFPKALTIAISAEHNTNT